MTPRLYAALFLLVLLGCGKDEPATPPSAAPATPSGPPAAAADETTRELGEVDLGKDYRYAFKVRNQGGSPLRLTLDRKNCTCTDVDVSSPIEPGKEGTVTLRWHTSPGARPEQVLAAEVDTNDAKKPRLRFEVKFHLSPVIRLWPLKDDVDFDLIRPGQVAQYELKVYSLSLHQFELEVKPSHPGLQVDVTRLAAGARVGDNIALAGYQVRVKATDKLPTGGFRESLDFAVTGDPPRTFTLPVFGERSTGALSVEPNPVTFSKNQLAEGDSQKVLVRFTVPAADERLELARAEPAFLEADKPQKVRNGVWQLTIRIPKGNAEAIRYQPDGYFSGRVILKTSDPQAPEIQVRVRWLRPE